MVPKVSICIDVGAPGSSVWLHAVDVSGPLCFIATLLGLVRRCPTSLDPVGPVTLARVGIVRHSWLMSWPLNFVYRFDFSFSIARYLLFLHFTLQGGVLSILGFFDRKQSRLKSRAGHDKLKRLVSNLTSGTCLKALVTPSATHLQRDCSLLFSCFFHLNSPLLALHLP
jgi:hypothetical protein